MPDEFQRIRDNIGKEVEVVMVSHKGEWPPESGVLVEVSPYSAIDIRQGSCGRLTDELTCPFVGATAGIKSIRDSNGHEIYHNDGLRYEKGFYDPWQNKEDNEFINKMRRAKFGEGHDYKMFD
ncbi:MAG: hypothetical protein V1900_01435 [Candidatus Aenigmatarchaeota archaeon]